AQQRVEQLGRLCRAHERAVQHAVEAQLEPPHPADGETHAPAPARRQRARLVGPLGGRLLRDRMTHDDEIHRESPRSAIVTRNTARDERSMKPDAGIVARPAVQWTAPPRRDILGPSMVGMPITGRRSAPQGARGSHDLGDPALYLNRELSALEFQKRVLAQARDPATPLLERMRFLGICSTNLDRKSTRL